MNKKSSLADLFLFMIVAFIIAVIAGILLYISYEANNKLQEVAPSIQEGMSNSTNVSQILADTVGRVPQAYENLKWITVAYIFAMVLSMLVASFLVRSHPIIFIPYLFIWVLAIVLAPILSNAYEVVRDNPDLAATFQGFFAQNWLLANLPMWVIVVGGLAAILMFVNMGRNQ